MKKCKRCLTDKPLSDFRQHGKYYESRCRFCENESSKEWAKNNRAKATETAKKYRQANPQQHAEAVKKYNKAHPDRRRKTHNTYMTKRKKEDIDFKIACNLRNRMNQAVKTDQKTGSAVDDLGMPIPEFRQYIADKFPLGLTWDNYGSTWHLDHIIPLASFKLSEREQFLEAAHFSNYQPLFITDNLKKGKKILDNRTPRV